MGHGLLLVGSVPLESVEAVFDTFGRQLGPFLRSMPDGEIGDGRWWVIRLQYQVFNGHPDLETVHRPALDDGVERLVPRNRTDNWVFRAKVGRRNRTLPRGLARTSTGLGRLVAEWAIVLDSGSGRTLVPVLVPAQSR